MKWPTWNQAAVAAVISLAVYFIARRSRPTRFTTALLPAAKEFALVAGLYTVWRLARELPFTHEPGAIDRGRQINDFQQAIGLPSELSLQRFVLDHDVLGWFMNYYYAIAHVPTIIAFMVWMFVWRRDAYPRWRTGLAIVTAFCLLVRVVRVAPPRLVPELGYVDLSSVYGLSVYGPVGTGVSDQFAAMPSIHIAWAAVVSFGIFAATTSRWRWVFLVHVVLTTLAVSATGHHWWLDSFVALGLLAVALIIDSSARRVIRGARSAAGRLPARPIPDRVASHDECEFEPK